MKHLTATLNAFIYSQELDNNNNNSYNNNKPLALTVAV